MRVLSLFSGIGGFDIGLERAGMQTVAFCEFEPYCQAVLKRHWPEVPIYDDVRTLSADTLRRDGVWPIDVIAGGFPCQDLSFAGKRAGIEGERSGLWSEFARLIGEVRPRFAIMENVPGLLSAGHGRVLGDLAALGYDAVWDCVPASAVGAPHRRDRVWIVAYAPSERRGEAGRDRPDEPAPWTSGRSEDAADAGNARLEGWQRGGVPECASQWIAWSRGASIPHTASAKRARQRAVTGGQQSGLADSVRRQPEPRLGGMADGLPDWLDSSLWLEEPEGVPRVATGIENRASRLKALGNSIVPQVAFLIGQAVMESTR
jgi:DNA (cytosine-5)-methyltransferase 1